MSTITSVEIEGFRTFRKLRVNGLTPVSLIVGPNNAGKTALLEALEALASEDSPFLLYRAAFSRGELRWRRKEPEDWVELDVRHWFHGHALEDGSSFRLSATGDRARSVARTIQRVPPDALPPFVPRGLQITIERPGSRSPLPTLPLTVDDFLGAGAPSRFAAFGFGLSPPVGFVTTERLLPAELGRLWTTVELTPAEERVIEALRLVEPAIDRIAISENNGTASAKVLLRGAHGPVPLGTLGEGVSRILTLAVHLAVTRGGFLFIDEIENGLHWSVIPKIWHFLVETARVLDVQVFATTHSRDCLDGIAILHRNHPALAERISVHRLEAGRETAVRLDASGIADYLEMEIEAR